MNEVLKFMWATVRSSLKLSVFSVVFYLNILVVCRKGHLIYEQLRAMGVSTDWDRACFTMDDVRNY